MSKKVEVYIDAKSINDLGVISDILARDADYIRLDKSTSYKVTIEIENNDAIPTNIAFDEGYSTDMYLFDIGRRL